MTASTSKRSARIGGVDDHEHLDVVLETVARSHHVPADGGDGPGDKLAIGAVKRRLEVVRVHHRDLRAVRVRRELTTDPRIRDLGGAAGVDPSAVVDRLRPWRAWEDPRRRAVEDLDQRCRADEAGDDVRQPDRVPHHRDTTASPIRQWSPGHQMVTFSGKDVFVPQPGDERLHAAGSWVSWSIQIGVGRTKRRGRWSLAAMAAEVSHRCPAPLSTKPRVWPAMAR